MTAIAWGGAVFGILGALLVALQVRASGFGFMAYAASNICWIAFALETGNKPIFIMNFIFIALAMLGFYRWCESEKRLGIYPPGWWS